MSKLLLLVQNEADVKHLPAAAQAILNSAITGVWCVFSPAVTVNASEAASKLDSEIETLRTAERQAADRSDYTAAAGYKSQREGKELDRAGVLRDAWKSAPAEERQAKTKAIFAPFGDVLKAKGLAVRITGHSDHYDRDQWVAMLNSLSGVWFKEFTPGSFLVAWPEAVETSLQQPVGQYPGVRREIPTEVVTQADKEKFREQSQAAQKPMSRAEELMKMKHFTFVAAAKKVGVDITGKSKEVATAEIITAERKAGEPELGEY